MVKLKEVSLENIGCFKGNVTLELEDGVNIFVGPNGSGKTTILDAIVNSLLGRYSRTIDDIVSSGSNSSYMSVSFSTNEEVVEVIRHLKPNTRHILKIDGRQVADRLNEVSRHLSRYGISESALEILYAPQWAMFNWIVMPPRERIRFFSKIFGVEELTKKSDKICEIARNIPIIALDKKELANLHEEMKLLLDRINKWQTSGSRELYNCRSELNNLRKERESILAQISELKSLLSNKNKLDKCMEQIKQLGFDPDDYETEEDLHPIFEEYDSLASKYQNLPSHTQLMASIASKKKELEAIEKKMAELEDLVLGEYLIQDLLQNKEELLKSRRILENSEAICDLHLEAAKSRICPVCKQPLDKSRAFMLKNAVKALRKSSVSISDIDRLISEIDSRISKSERAEQELNNLAAKRESLEKYIESLQALIPQDFSAEDRDTIKARMDLLQNAKSKLYELILLRRELSGHDLESLDKAHRTLTDRLSELNTRIPELEKRLNDLIREEAAVSEAKIRLDKIIKRTDEIEKDAEKADKHNHYRSELLWVGKFFASSGMGRLVIKEYSGAVEHVMNSFLSSYGSDMEVRIPGSFDEIYVRFLSRGDEVSSSNLSGGQKVIVSAALRFGVISLLDLPKFVILDEPAAGLDNDSIAVLRDMLSEMANQGFQLLVSSHHEELCQPGFNVIDLSQLEVMNAAEVGHR